MNIVDMDFEYTEHWGLLECFEPINLNADDYIYDLF